MHVHVHVCKCMQIQNMQACCMHVVNVSSLCGSRDHSGTKAGGYEYSAANDCMFSVNLDFVFVLQFPAHFTV